MEVQGLTPHARPHRRMEDLAEGDRHPTQKPRSAPAAAHALDQIHHPAEPRFQDVRRERNPLLMVQPIIDEGQSLLSEVQKIHPRFRVTRLRQRLQQFGETVANGRRPLPHLRSVGRGQCCELGLAQMKQRIPIQKLEEFLLVFSFDLIRLEKKTKVVMAMPDAPLAVHPGRPQVVFDTSPAVGKQHLQTPVVQPTTQVSANRFPVLIHPKTHYFMGFSHTFRGPSPAQVRLAQRFSAILESNLGAVDHQKLKAPIFKRWPVALRFGQFLQLAPNRAFTRPLAADPLSFLRRKTIRKVDRLAHRRFQRRSLIAPIRLDPQLFDQGENDGSRRSFLDLVQTVTNLAERSQKNGVDPILPP